MNIEINRMLAPITVLGAGRRFGLWVQGCGLRCPGCASVDTWTPGQGCMHDVQALAAQIADQVRQRNLDGLTLTGGEPLDQADALAELIGQIRRDLDGWGKAAQFDVLMFTGYPVAVTHHKAGKLWPMLDVAICGPYRQRQPSDMPLVASSNQKMLILTDLGHSKYPLTDNVPRMQAVSDGTNLVMVGLPKPGDLDAIRQRLAKRGVFMKGTSWLNPIV